MASPAQRDEQVGKIDAGVEDRDESIRHPVRRALHQRPTVIRASHTEFLTGPVPKEFLDQLVRGPMTQGHLQSRFEFFFKNVITERATRNKINLAHQAATPSRT